MGKHKKGTAAARANNKKASPASVASKASTAASVSKVSSSSKVLKKQKQATKRQALNVRLSAQVTAAADLRKNKNTGPVGDFKMFQNVLDSLVTKQGKTKATATSSSASSSKAAKKASSNQKKQRQQFMRDISFHGAVRKHADFVSDPAKAITTHVQNVIRMQADAETA